MQTSLLAQNSKSNSTAGFAGFALPTSNTTYAPNQFFDVCLPNCSRGCVRLVALLIRKTLGWCDSNGNPQTERHAVAWSDFEAAGISRDMIRAAIDEAVDGHFIRCIRQPKTQKAGQPSVSGLYELQWDERLEYVKDPKQFRGFFAGEGNRTYIPNQFFDQVIPHETLALVKVVGSVIRFSIGYQNKWGHRRANVSLSYQHIQNYSHIRDRKTLSEAIRRALKSNYIERVKEGYFDPDAGKLSLAAVYAVKWLDTAVHELNGRKNPPGEMATKSRSEKPTGNGRKTLPGERSEKPTGIEIKQRNKTYKQQEASILEGEAAVSFEKLKDAGFDEIAARAMALKFSFDRIERQINWIDRRSARSNRLGMLRKAIEQNWVEPKPTASFVGKLGQPNSGERRGKSFEQALSGVKGRLLNQSSTKS
jgi:hypothetical protein